MKGLTQSLELIHQRVTELPAVFEGDKAVEGLSLHLVRSTHHRSLRHSRVLRQGCLNLRCAHQVAWGREKICKAIAEMNSTISWRG